MTSLLGTPGRVHLRQWEIAFAFVLPLTSLFKMSLVGTIFAQDIIGLGMLAVMLVQPGAFERLAPAKPFLVFAGMWLMGQVFTDLVRQSAFEDYSRGWAKIIFFTIQFCALWLFLSRDWRLFVFYMLGLSMQMILGSKLLPPPYSTYPWKYGLGSGLSLLAAVAGSWLSLHATVHRQRITPLLVGFTGVLALWNGARATFGIALLSALYMAVVGYVAPRRALARSITGMHFAGMLLVGIASGQVLIAAYASAAEHGLLGDEARAKYESQAGGDVSVVQGGRVESLVSVEAIKDSPILGHGSWARDIYYVRMLQKKKWDLGIKSNDGAEGDADLIPSHSHLFGAWVEAGIAGGLFWGWVLVLCVVTLYTLLKLERTASPIVITSAFGLFWSIPFSPFGAEARFSRAAQIAILLFVLDVARKSKPLVIQLKGAPRAVILSRRPLGAPVPVRRLADGRLIPQVDSAARAE